MPSKNEFQVDGRTVIVTGGSQGLGLAVARQLAARGANVVIVARDQTKLLNALANVEAEASNPETQRFLQISADLTVATEAVRVVDDVVRWNSGNPPDIVWCCAGTAHPTLFIETPVSEFSTQMQMNYFTSLHMSHAIISCWLHGSGKNLLPAPTTSSDKSGGRHTPPPLPRHLIFTTSFLALFSFAGYTSYSPAKAAIRSLSDTLSQEMNLYSAANPDEPRVRLHTLFPAGIRSEGYDAEMQIKSDLTKLLEGDEPETPDYIASRCLKGLENGQELITCDWKTEMVKRSMLGGSVRGGFFRGVVDWLLASLMVIVMAFVRRDMDNQVRRWGRQYGATGAKGDKAPAKN